MEEQIQQLLTQFVAKFPIVALAYGVMSGAYIIFCTVAAWTTTKEDDKWAERLKIFFSLKK